MKSLLILTLFFNLQVFAKDDCSPVSVDISNMPANNNQSSLAWCFAWTATDLLSFYEKEKLSAYDLGVQYHNHKDIRDESAGDLTQVGGNDGIALIVALTGKGMCLEKDTNYTNSDWQRLSDMIKNLGDPNKSLIEIICEHNYQMGAPFKDLSTDVINILNKLEADKKIAGLLDVTCKERYKFKNKYGVGTKTIEDSSPKDVIARMDQLLSTGSPVSITYDVDVIMKGNSYKKQTANHSSTIIGRRKTFLGKCEYLIKQSWGSKCPKRSKISCKEGNFWIPRSTLENNIYEINWLQKR